MIYFKTERGETWVTRRYFRNLAKVHFHPLPLRIDGPRGGLSLVDPIIKSLKEKHRHRKAPFLQGSARKPTTGMPLREILLRKTDDVTSAQMTGD